MSTKLKQWGAVFIAYGVVALVLPRLTGLQLKIFNAFGEHSFMAAIGATALGGIMWFIGTMGGAGSAQAAAEPSSPPPPLPNAYANTGMNNMPATCPKCGAAVPAGDRFCMACGTPIAAAPPPQAAPPPPFTPTPSRQGGGCAKKGCLIIVVLIAAAVAWLFFGGSVGTYTAPPRSEPAVPQRMAGTLTEFPVDPASANRVEPTNVITQSFEPSATAGKTPTIAAQPNTFPPGIDTNVIPQTTTNMTSATYRGTGSSVPVNVHVLQSTNPNVAGQYAQNVARSSGGQMQGTRVQSPKGATYEGWSVRSPTIMVFILTNLSAGNIIIIYTPQPSGFETAQRLASSVGNGRGLRDYPQVMETFGALPASPPPGYGLSNMTNFTGTELTSSIDQAMSGADPQVVKALDQILQAVRVLVPVRGTMAQYRNQQSQEKGLLVGNYGSARKAFIAYRLVSWTFGLTMKKTNAPGFEALSFSDNSGKVLVFQKGPYIGLTLIPAAGSDSELADFARSLQF